MLILYNNANTQMVYQMDIILFLDKLLHLNPHLKIVIYNSNT